MQQSSSGTEDSLIISEDKIFLEPGIDILIYDFDHTLFLSNSTEEYLDCARPKVLVAIVLAILEGLQPWKLILKENNRFVYRDAIRVSVVSTLFPWTLLIWKSKTSTLATSFANKALISQSKQKQLRKRIIVSNGFAFILKPLLRDLDFQADILIATHLKDLNHSPRNLGKLKILEEKLDKEELESACCITDNKEDASLLKAVRQPILRSWPTAKHFRACQNIYIPFVYTEGSNRGNKRYFFKRILLQDYIFILTAYGIHTHPNLFYIMGLLIIFLSFSCIYEAGYYENDFYEVNYEQSKGIGKKFEKFKDYPIEVGAWSWALLFSVLGLILLDSPNIPVMYTSTFSASLLSWIAFLGSVRILFRIYNYSNIKIRMLLYPVLQVCRFSGFLLFISTNIIGFFLIFSQIFCRWFWYLVYRANGDRTSIPHHVIRLAMFTSLSIGYSLSLHQWHLLSTKQFMLGLAWCFVLCTNQFLNFLQLCSDE